MPPPAIQLKRIALALGIPDTAPEPARNPAASHEAQMQELMSSGMGVLQGRPDDPLLDFLDLPPRA